jgi:cytochrome c
MRFVKPINLFASVFIGLATACGGGEKVSESGSAPPAVEERDEKAEERAVESATAAGPEEIVAEETPVSQNEYSKDEIVEVGYTKMEGSDCSSCHAKEEKIIGPPLIEIAMQYQNNAENISKLAAKIINGGSGVWGDYPMPPHQNLSEKDAKAMAAYILQLK